MKTVRFGIIGCGLMGREFLSAAARWNHLTAIDVRPEIVAICGRNLAVHRQWAERVPTVRQVTDDYRALLANPDVDAVYCAVPHHLHEEIYCATIESHKHLLGEKPFGIDAQANRAILACAARHPQVFVRCASEFPFFPAAQAIGAMLDRGAFGQVLEASTGFLHSSDLDPQKPINWKRTLACNGAYGCMGDLGMHVCHVPFRAGWMPRNVRAILSKIIAQRPDGRGGMAACETWDNATLLCETADPQTGSVFPWTLKTQRIAPGERNTWYVEILGTRACTRFSTRNPRLLERLEYTGGAQVWSQVQMGYETPYATITGGIFEFGFCDAILQMWAAFLYELTHGRTPARFAGCVTPAETALSHRLFTAALASHERGATVAVEPLQ